MRSGGRRGHRDGGGADAVEDLLERAPHPSPGLLPRQPRAAAARAGQRQHQGDVEQADRQVRREGDHAGERRAADDLEAHRARRHGRPIPRAHRAPRRCGLRRHRARPEHRASGRAGADGRRQVHRHHCRLQQDVHPRCLRGRRCRRQDLQAGGDVHRLWRDGGARRRALAVGAPHRRKQLRAAGGLLHVDGAGPAGADLDAGHQVRGLHGEVRLHKRAAERLLRSPLSSALYREQRTALRAA
mmetsp:Transcript_14551/g.42043  ORF Transcript_14551/g.42043 Transcript_14551/m.42043 type:complete len:243 (+) Transcript_14551:1321-2049(+)